MNSERTENNKDIIRQAYQLLYEEDFLYKYSAKIQLSDYKGLDQDTYEKIGNKLKCIRQDFTKIMVVMNVIDRTYTMYQENRYTDTYFSIKEEQPLQELGCQIEYLFVKYRVILEYLETILKTVLLPNLSAKDKTKYDTAVTNSNDRQDSGFTWMTQYIADHYNDKCPIMNTGWFQNLKKTRNKIIHKGASCVAFENKETLIINIYTPEDIQNDKEQIEWDDYYKMDNSLIRYDRYWGLYFAKLIVFSNAVLEFVYSLGTLSDNNEWIINQFNLDKAVAFLDGEAGKKLPDIRDVPCNLLKRLIDE